MSNEVIIDFINCSEEECLQFAEKVNKDEFDNEQLKKTFNNFIFRIYTDEEAIKLIKNVSLTKYKVSHAKTFFQFYSSRTLLTVAQEFNRSGSGSSNFKILKALCYSQFNEDFTDFKENVNKYILFIIRERLNILVNEDEKLGSYYRQIFKEVTGKYEKYFSLSY